MSWLRKIEANWKEQKVLLLIFAIFFVVPHIDGTTAASDVLAGASWALASLVVIFYKFAIRDDVSNRVNNIIKETWEAESKDAQESLNIISSELEKKVPDFDRLISATTELEAISEDLRQLSEEFDLFTKVTKSVIYLLGAGLFFLFSKFVRVDIWPTSQDTLYIESVGLIIFLWGFFFVIEIFLIWHRLWDRDVEDAT